MQSATQIAFYLIFVFISRIKDLAALMSWDGEDLEAAIRTCFSK